MCPNYPNPYSNLKVTFMTTENGYYDEEDERYHESGRDDEGPELPNDDVLGGVDIDDDVYEDAEFIVGNPEPAPNQMKSLVEHLQRENARLTDQNQRLQKLAVDIREDKFELEKFIADKIYPALEGQTALNIAALEALQLRLEEYYAVADTEANPVIQ